MMGSITHQKYLKSETKVSAMTNKRRVNELRTRSRWPTRISTKKQRRSFAVLQSPIWGEPYCVGTAPEHQALHV